jgi:hypothetical protein
MQLLRHGLVLMRGTQYWVVTNLLDTAREALHKNSEWAQQVLFIPEFWWEIDPQGKAVVWRATPEGPQIVAAEAGSKLVPQEGAA